MTISLDVFTDLYSKLKSMRFSGMAEELKRQFEEPAAGPSGADERILLLVNAEYELRRQKKLNRLITSADFRYPNASIDLQLAQTQGADSNLLQKLAEGRWIDDHKNLMITGPTGAGKSYVGCALGIAAACQYRNVRYERTGHLLRKLAGAEEKMELTETLNRYSKYDLLILDDFGLMNLDTRMCRNLFELIDARDGRKSTILISQLPVSDWYNLFSENTYADACLDRLTKGSYRLTFDGVSLRGRQKPIHGEEK